MRELLATVDALELASWEAYFDMGAEEAVLEDLKKRAASRLARRSRGR